MYTLKSYTLSFQVNRGISNHSMLRPKRLFQELQRRRVFNTVSIYILSAWVTLQVAEQAFPALNIPERAIRYIWLGSFMLLPLVLVFGWRYDLSANGIKRTESMGSGTGQGAALRGHDHWLIGSLSILAFLFISVMLFEISQVKPSTPVVVVPQENSIAVIPFDVCEGRLSDQTLATGLGNVIINRLGQRDRLKIIGRGSVDRVLETTASKSSLAALLGVNFMLNGTLCRDGVELLLHIELTDSRGFIVWENQFRQFANDRDQVEEQLSTLVDNAVAAQMGDVVVFKNNLAVNRVALEQLIIGREFRERNEFKKARTALDSALGEQPGYNEAMWELALLEADEGMTVENVADAYEKSKPVLLKALDSASLDARLYPRNFQANWVAGNILQFLGSMENDLAFRDLNRVGEEEVDDRQSRAMAHWADSERFYRTALSINPSHTSSRVSLAVVLARQNVMKRRESLDILLQGLETDPFDSRLIRFSAIRLVEFGRMHEAMEQLDRLEALPQGKGQEWAVQLELLQFYGQIDKKLEYQIELLESDTETANELLWHLWWTLSELDLLGLPEEKEKLEETFARVWGGHENIDSSFWILEELPPETRAAKYAEVSSEKIFMGWHLKSAQVAYAFWLTGQHDRASELFEALQYRDASLVWRPQQQREFAELLALGLMTENRREDGAPILREIKDELQSAVDGGVRHPAILMRLANIYGWQGNHDEALKVLDLAVDYGGYDLLICCEDFGSDLLLEVKSAFPKQWWQGLENDPRFIRLRTRMRSQVDRQRSNIRAMLQQSDMEALLTPYRPMPKSPTVSPGSTLKRRP